MMKTYKGSCHCGKVSYDVDMELGDVIECNCSICRKQGTLLSFVGEKQFHLLSGQDDLNDYQFNKKIIHHYFCSHCGVKSFGKGTGPDGAPMVAINVRCLDDVDLGALNVVQFDGKSQ